MRYRLCLVLLLSTAARGERCDPPAALAGFVASLPSDNAQRRAAIEERLKSDPDNFWLNRLFLDGSVYERAPIRDRYRAMFEAHPGNPDDEYLYARSLVGFNTKEALRIYAEILARDPDYPWVHYSQLEIFHAEAFRDRAKLRASFDRLVSVCPAWIEPYRYLNAMDAAAADAYVPRLRAMLEATKDPRKLRLYTTLWAAEFRLRPQPEWPAEKERVTSDLARLRGVEGTQPVIEAGAKLTGAGTPPAIPVVPPPGQAAFAASQAWQSTHPYPAKDASEEKKLTYFEAKLAATRDWIAMDPSSVTGYFDRLSALAKLGAPADQLAAAGDDALRVARKDSHAAGPSFIASLAEIYVERGVLLDRVPALIAEALKGFDDPEAVIEIDLAPTRGMVQANRMNLVRWHVDALATLSRCYEKLGRMQEARAVLAPVPSYLASHASADPGAAGDFGSSLRTFAALAHYSYWMRVAELDAREKKDQTALQDYREALAHWDAQRDELIARQRVLWKELGRPDDAWQAWVDSLPHADLPQRKITARPAFEAVHRPLPAARLLDLDGNPWPADRFRGTTTIAVVWATWCRPCVEELPYVSRLAERLKDRADTQVISLNTDEDPALARQFVETHGYKFPVLAAKNFAEDLMPYFAIPRTWIIRNGAIVEESEGFIGDGDQWVDRVLAEVK